MASALTEAHRLAQLRLGAITVERMRSLWKLLDPRALDDSVAEWLRSVLVVVDSQRQSSAQLAAAYVAALRASEIGFDEDLVEPVLADRLNLQAVMTSLVVTGPVSIKAAMRRSVNLGVAANVANARSARAAMRHVLDGGRETITRTIQADRRAAGYHRVTSGKACDFCSMLAGRGAVYGKASARFSAHDGCSCTAEPVFTR